MGRACTERLVKLGAVVYALDVVPVEIEGIKEFVRVNMGDKNSIDEGFRQLPASIDKFFFFAGITGERNTAKEVLLVNFVGNQYIMRQYLPNRMPTDSAVLIVTSVGANRWYLPENKAELEELVHAESWEAAEKILDQICDGLPVGNAYTYSKRALAYFTMLTATEFAPKGIRVNSIKPGNTKSGIYEEFKARFFRQHPDKDETDFARHYSLLSRTAEPREMAEPAIFMNSDMASFISGAELIIDYALDSAIFIGKEPDIYLGKKLVYPDK